MNPSCIDVYNIVVYVYYAAALVVNILLGLIAVVVNQSKNLI